MMRPITFLFSIALFFNSFAQCDTLMLNSTKYSLVSVSSANGSNGGEKTFDGDINTRWRSQGSGPHQIILDLGSSEKVTGFSVKTRWESAGRIEQYKVYISDDTSAFGSGERFGTLWYPNSKKDDTVYFGAALGRYAKFEFTSSSGDLQLSELSLFRDTCASSSKKNQPVEFPAISKKTTTDPAITLNATTINGKAVSDYSIISGPATISGNTLSLTKSAGKVRVKASVAGDASFFYGSRELEFEVIDLSTYYPTVSTKLIDAYPLEVFDTSAFYPIYINATIEEPSFLNITKVDLSIDGILVDAIAKDGFYYFGWSPKDFKTYSIDITAHGSNGNVKTISRSVKVTDQVQTQTCTSLKDAVIEYGSANSRDFYGTYNFPQFVGVYSQMVATMEVECPNGNCDDWDRWAYIEFKAPDGNWIQLIRYITPYNVGCTHKVDLTDYASLLQGEVEMHVFVDTWGTGGWQFTLNVEYLKGRPAYRYSMIEEVWDGAYNFGNPSNLQPVPDATIKTHKNSEDLKLVLSTTGHGWGANNTGNAAEFYHAKHDVMVQGAKAYEQDLWNNCNPNPDNCTGQQGTWQYNRAGWCPGAISPPNAIPLSGYLGGSEIKLGYKFEATYQDLCHPNNKNCQSGVTCADCNAGSNPVYYVDGQLISYNNKGLVYRDHENSLGVQKQSLKRNLTLDVFPNPSRGSFRVASPDITGSIVMGVYGVDGTQHKRYFFEHYYELESASFDVSELPSGIYFIELHGSDFRVNSKLIRE